MPAMPMMTFRVTVTPKSRPRIVHTIRARSWDAANARATTLAANAGTIRVLVHLV